ncbi:MAG: methyltransferase domain-containing protein [Rubrivivax sp.]|nr:MAG: methyltransferase domain-containing protein [Rubrivivax sp.]
MLQTPSHEFHNPDLLNLIPQSAKNLIEIGCSSGALAREFKKQNASCDYFGVEIDPGYAELARRHCNQVEVRDLDDVDTAFFLENKHRDVWIFGDTLEHFKNPWKVLEGIRNVMPGHACVIACIPNVQHWSLQVRLSMGDFNYEDSGLLDRTHLRWFTRKTIIQMFAQTGLTIIEGSPRIFDEPHREDFLELIGDLAEAAGANREEAMADATPLQYVIKAVPKT